MTLESKQLIKYKKLAGLENPLIFLYMVSK